MELGNYRIAGIICYRQSGLCRYFYFSEHEFVVSILRDTNTQTYWDVCSCDLDVDKEFFWFGFPLTRVWQYYDLLQILMLLNGLQKLHLDFSSFELQLLNMFSLQLGCHLIEF